MAYRVKKFMIYQGREYGRGAEWIPLGLRADRAIIEAGLVYEEPDAPAEEPAEEPALLIEPEPPQRTKRGR